MVSIIIVTHGEFGAYLLEAAEEIVGRPGDQTVVVATISRRIGLVEVREKIEHALDSALRVSSAEGALILCDMLGGTPCNEVLLASRKYANVEVLVGVNLYMVISAFINARRLSLAALSAKVLEDSKRSVADARAFFKNRQQALSSKQ